MRPGYQIIKLSDGWVFVDPNGLASEEFVTREDAEMEAEFHAALLDLRGPADD